MPSSRQPDIDIIMKRSMAYISDSEIEYSDGEDTDDDDSMLLSDDYIVYKKPQIKAVEGHERDDVERKLEEDAATIWPTLTPEQRSHKPYILAALLSPTLPPYELFEETIPSQFRCCDRDVTLAYVRRNDYGDEMAQSRGSKIPEAHRGDKAIMLEVCSKNSEGLSIASDRMRQDYDVVKAAVARNYKQISLAPHYLQNYDVDLCAIACSQSAQAFLLFGPENKSRAFLDYETYYRVVTEIGGQHLLHAREELRNDPEMILAALSNLSNAKTQCEVLIPTKLLSDIGFLTRAVGIEPLVYMLDLPRKVLHDEGLAISAVANLRSTTELLDCAIDRVPRLASSGDRLARVLLQRPTNVEFRILPSARDDADRMIEAIAEDPTRMLILGGRLQTKPFFSRWLGSAPTGNFLRAYLYLRPEWKRDVDIASHVIENLPFDQTVVQAAAVASPVAFKKRNVLLAYLRGALSNPTTIQYRFPLPERLVQEPFGSILLDAVRDYRNDQEVLTALFAFNKKFMATDIEFLRRAVKTNASLYSLALTEDLRCDVEVICNVCMAMENDVTNLDFASPEELRVILRAACVYIGNSELFNAGMSVLEAPDMHSAIRKVVACEDLNRNIAKLLSVPLGKGLSALRFAAAFLPDMIWERNILL